MRFTKGFIKTERNASSDARAVSHKLLYRGGFIRQVATGRYAFLPLGYRVKKKVIRIIEKEMDRINAERMELPIMQPIDVWEITNRDEAFGELMHVVDDHYGRKFVLNATGEALMTELFGSMKLSYKDLPVNVYQFLAKFRDEVRPRGGLIRVREFLMKDAYNFEVDEVAFMKTYDSYMDAYGRIFKRLGLETIPVIADNGALGGDYSHEHMLVTSEEVEKLDIYLDENEEEKKGEIIDASDDSGLYKDIIKIYHRNPEKTLKNLVYVIDDNKYICITIRGDYKVDFKTKLKRLLKYKTIRPATADEIKTLGSFIGYVSSIDIDPKVQVIIDETVKYNKNYYDGAHKNRVFRKNVNFGRDIKVKETVDVHEDKTFSAGGDRIVLCDHCDYKANVEKAEFVREEVNMDQEMKSFEIVEQPEWVCTMDDNVQHYKKPKSHFLKNVVYRNKDDRLIIAVMRGDLEANANKVANLVGVDALEMADDEDLARIGTKSGWVHSWGHDKDRKDVLYIGDIALEKSRNLIGGQKEKTTDSFNVNYGRDFEVAKIGDIASAQEGDKCPKCKGGYLREKKAIEMGHCFKYDNYYSVPHKANFVDKDGKEKPMWMGAYGIGVGRAMAAVVEVHHDDKGIIWPVNVAPFKIHIVSLGKSKDVISVAEKLYESFEKHYQSEVLWDDRMDVSAGVKFNDADLIGVPVRVVVSDKTLKEDSVEVKLRWEDDGELVEYKDEGLMNFVSRLLK